MSRVGVGTMTSALAVKAKQRSAAKRMLFIPVKHFLRVSEQWLVASTQDIDISLFVSKVWFGIRSFKTLMTIPSALPFMADIVVRPPTPPPRPVSDPQRPAGGIDLALGFWTVAVAASVVLWRLRKRRVLPVAPGAAPERG